MSGPGKTDYGAAVVAIDAGGTYFKSALISAAGELLGGSFSQAPACSRGTKAEIIRAYEHIIRRECEYARDHGVRIGGVGISTPGPFDYQRGMSLMTHKFQAIKGVGLRDELYALGIFSNQLPVVFMQDVHAFLAGEHWTGAIRECDNAAVITLGTGLGFGLLQDGKILDNGKGGPLIPLFKHPYRNGILEDIISRRGIIARYRQYRGTQDADIDVRDIAEKARNNDVQALGVFRETGEILAGELMEILVAREISTVVFGGQISKSFDLFGPAFQEKVTASGKAIRVVPGRNIDFSSLIGVAQTAFSTRPGKNSRGRGAGNKHIVF